MGVSAVGVSGQIAIYNAAGGPCLRCIFPETPKADCVASCEENGVLGPIPGILGTMAALEAIKLLAEGGLKDSCLHGRLLIYDALDTVQPCRTLRIKRRQGCNHCNQAPAYGEVQTCPIPAHATQNGNNFCISPTALRGRLASNAPNVIIDVRQCPHFMVAHLAGAINWPLTELLRLGAQELQQRAQDLVTQSPPDKDTTVLVVCVCRRGNDSLVATKRLRDIGVQAWNLHGGLQALAALGQHPWSQQTLS